MITGGLRLRSRMDVLCCRGPRAPVSLHGWCRRRCVVCSPASCSPRRCAAAGTHYRARAATAPPPSSASWARASACPSPPQPAHAVHSGTEAHSNRTTTWSRVHLLLPHTEPGKTKALCKFTSKVSYMWILHITFSDTLHVTLCFMFIACNVIFNVILSHNSFSFIFHFWGNSLIEMLLFTWYRICWLEFTCAVSGHNMLECAFTCFFHFWKYTVLCKGLRHMQRNAIKLNVSTFIYI